MNDKPTDGNPDSLENQLGEILRKVNLQFTVPDSAQPTDASAPGDTTGHDRPPVDPLAPIREFSRKPRDIKTHLDRYVIRQDEAKKVLSVAVCDHYNHVRRCLDDPVAQAAEYSKHNIILLGPTGVGKTYLMRCIARLIGVPFVKADATKFSETGYVGHDVEDLVRDLVKAADGNVELAQYGIIYLDEVDKIAARSTDGGKDVSGRGVQMNLLKLMEDTEVSLFSQTDLLGQMQAIMDMQRGKNAGARAISTRHILFIVSGAFDKLSDQIRRRVTRSSIGFAGGPPLSLSDSDYLNFLQTRDLVDYGFEPEFVGRLPVRVICGPLSAEDLERIMVESEENILAQYRRDFEGYGIGLTLTRDAIADIAQKAYDEGTGARGLMTVLERTLRDYKFQLPSTTLRRFELDSRTVKDPEAALKDLLDGVDDGRHEAAGTEAEAYAARFEKASGLKLQFSRDAVAALAHVCSERGCTVEAFFQTELPGFAYGLQLIARNTGRSTFRVTQKFIEAPEEELSRRIAGSVKKSTNTSS